MSKDSDRRKIGRVVIELSSITPNASALQKAVEMAHALNTEIEGLYITDDEFEQICGLSIARTVSASGRKVARNAAENLKREVYLASRSMRRQFDQLADRARLKHQFKAVDGKPLSELLKACSDESADSADSLLVLSETVALRHIPEIDQLLTRPSQLRGILMIGPGANKRAGPTLIAPDNIDHVPEMLELAQAVNVKDKPLIIFLTGDDAQKIGQQADRLQAGLKPDTRLKILTANIPDGRPQVITAAIMRLGCGLVITGYGGALVPGKRDILPLANALPCPLMIMR